MNIDFASLKETYNELASDVECARKIDARVYPIDFIKRTYTRAFFAMVEGIIYQFKVVSLQANEHTKVFNQNEILTLKEQAVKLKNNGTAANTKAKLPLMPNIIFSINSLAKSLQITYSIDKDGQGYEAMQKAIKIRDKITHPKNKQSTIIDDTDMEILKNANIWFRDEVVKLFCLIYNSDRLPYYSKHIQDELQSYR